MSTKQNQYKIGTLLIAGKTKKIYRVLCEPSLCIIESKNAITANDDPSLTREFETKAIAANTTTSCVFELLKKPGVPLAYKEMLSETSFLSENCVMVPLEVVVRRYAVGSYLKRRPSYKRSDEHGPIMFDDSCVEFFLKTTGGKCEFRGNDLISNLPVEDPFIFNAHTERWALLHPKVEYGTSDSFICNFEPLKILDENVAIGKMEILAKQVFEILEAKFAEQNIRLIDFKIEFGINSKGELVIADVIDNDSWRIVTSDWEDLSKQSFRDGQDLSIVERKYLQVMEIVQRFWNNLLSYFKKNLPLKGRFFILTKKICILKIILYTSSVEKNKKFQTYSI